MNAGTCGSGTAREISDDTTVLAAARSIDVDKVDVRDVDIAWVRRASCVVDVEVALVKHNRRISVLNVNVLVCDVVDVAVSDVRASPGLETSTVLAVKQGDVFEPCVGDEVFDTGILANGAHGDTVSTVAPEILDEDVGGIGLRAEAVVANVDAGVGHGQAVNVQGVKTIGVLGEGLMHRSV